MTFDGRIGAAFGVAGETVKQLLALATATIGGAIALFDDDAQAGIDFGPNDGLLKFGLIMCGLSVISGLFALGAIVGQLGGSATPPSVYAKGITTTYTTQLASYGLAIAAIVAHVVR